MQLACEAKHRGERCTRRTLGRASEPGDFDGKDSRRRPTSDGIRPSPNGQGAGGPGDAGRPEGRLPGCNTAVLETLTAAPYAGKLKLQSSRHGDSAPRLTTTSI